MTSDNSVSLILRRLDEIERKLDDLLQELRTLNTPAAIGYSVRRAIFQGRTEERKLAPGPHLAFFGQPPKCEVAHTSLSIRPSKVPHGDSDARRGHMAPKPEPARLAYVFGMVLRRSS